MRVDDNRRGMPIRLDGGPWQCLPPMQSSLAAEKAGIDGALRLIECTHLYYAVAHKDTNRRESVTRLNSALDAARLRTDIMAGQL